MRRGAGARWRTQPPAARPRFFKCLTRSTQTLLVSSDRIWRPGQVPHDSITQRYSERDTYTDRDLDYGFTHALAPFVRKKPLRWYLTRGPVSTAIGAGRASAGPVSLGCAAFIGKRKPPDSRPAAQ